MVPTCPPFDRFSVPSLRRGGVRAAARPPDGVVCAYHGQLPGPAEGRSRANKRPAGEILRECETVPCAFRGGGVSRRNNPMRRNHTATVAICGDWRERSGQVVVTGRWDARR